MTDEEILERLAAIEGFRIEVSKWPPGKTGKVYRVHPEEPNPFGYALSEWNPLEDKAQAFDLLEKYEMDVICEYHRGLWTVSSPRTGTVTEPDLRRAICLAVIASKGDEHGR